MRRERWARKLRKEAELNRLLHPDGYEGEYDLQRRVKRLKVKALEIYVSGERERKLTDSVYALIIIQIITSAAIILTIVI